MNPKITADTRPVRQTAPPTKTGQRRTGCHTRRNKERNGRTPAVMFRIPAPFPWQSGDGSIFLSTRRIQSIIKGWTVCESIEYAIELALAHYSDEEAKALVNAWKAIAPAEKTVADDDQTLDKPSEIG